MIGKSGRRSLILLGGILLLAACAALEETRADSVRQYQTYTPGTETILNPDRGFMDWATPILFNSQPGELQNIRHNGASLAFIYIDLASVPDGEINEAFLSTIETTFSSARAAGIKLVVRATYDRIGDASSAQERTLAGIADDVSRIAPVLHRNSDMIFVLQAGLLGKYGEWHGWPDHFLTPQARRAFAELALKLAPANRFIQMRTPAHMMELFPEPLPPERWFDGSAQARMGHHNDCFLSSPTDVGTYASEPIGRAQRQYIEAAGRHAPVGGETCAGSGQPRRTHCETAMDEMARQHWSFLNKAYYAPDIERWRAEGCYDEIANRLGYRYRLIRAEAPQLVRAGDKLKLTLEMANDGWAGLYNPRDAELVLVGRNGERWTTPLEAPSGPASQGHPVRSADPRTWLPAPGLQALLTFTPLLPEGLAPGVYELELALPDPDPRIRARADYAIRLANTDIWNENTGTNRLNIAITVR